MHKRNCPQCNKDLIYYSPISFKKAKAKNDKCRSCGCTKITDELISKILELNANGILNREIAKIVKIHHRTVSTYLKKYDKKSNFANQPIDIIDEFSAKCRKCNSIKNISEFQFGRKGQKYEYKFSYCNECRKKQVYLNLNKDIEKYLSNRFNRLKFRAKKLNIICAITKEEFINQYNKQKGLCFLTDVKLICEVGSKSHRDSLSVDKLIPSLGYTNSNVVFLSNKINTVKNDLSLDEIKQWMPEWYSRIENYLKI